MIADEGESVPRAPNRRGMSRRYTSRHRRCFPTHLLALLSYSSTRSPEGKDELRLKSGFKVGFNGVGGVRPCCCLRAVKSIRSVWKIEVMHPPAQDSTFYGSSPTCLAHHQEGHLMDRPTPPHPTPTWDGEKDPFDDIRWPLDAHLTVPERGASCG